MSVAEHPDSKQQAMLGRLAFLMSGSGVARVRIYPAPRRTLVTDPVGVSLIVELPLLSPPATAASGVMMLRPGAPGLNAISATAAWAAVVNGNGDTSFDCDVSASGGTGEIWLSAGGTGSLVLFAGGETTLTSGVMG